MTLHQVSEQLFHLSLGGYFNGEKFTEERLYRHLQNFLRPEVGDHVIMMIALADGWWYFRVNHYGDGLDQYDYDIPETREKELLIKRQLTASA